MDADGHAAARTARCRVVRTASGSGGRRGGVGPGVSLRARSRSRRARTARSAARVAGRARLGVPRPGDRGPLPRARGHATRVDERRLPAAWHRGEGGVEVAGRGRRLGRRQRRRKDAATSSARPRPAGRARARARRATAAVTLYGRASRRGARALLAVHARRSAPAATDWIVEYTFDRDGPRELAFRHGRRRATAATGSPRRSRGWICAIRPTARSRGRCSTTRCRGREQRAPSARRVHARIDSARHRRDHGVGRRRQVVGRVRLGRRRRQGRRGLQAASTSTARSSPRPRGPVGRSRGSGSTVSWLRVEMVDLEDKFAHTGDRDSHRLDSAASVARVDRVESFTSDERARLAPYFSNADGPVFALVGLPETVKAAMFARYSRYPGTLRRLFLDEFADSLPERAARRATTSRAPARRSSSSASSSATATTRWPSSAARTSPCEWVSNVLTKVLQRPRLAGYLEQSTRYIAYDAPMPGGGYRYYRDRGARPRVRGGDGRAVRRLLGGAAARDARGWTRRSRSRPASPTRCAAARSRPRRWTCCAACCPPRRCRTWASTRAARPTSS